MRYRRQGEPYNAAEELIINRIRRHPSLYASRMDVMASLFLPYCGPYSPWTNGELVEEVYPGIEPRPFVLTREYAENIFEYGHQRTASMIKCDWSKESVLHAIPDDITTEWLELVEDYVTYLVKFTERDYQVHIESYTLISHGRETVGFASFYPRYLQAYADAIIGLDEIVKAHGWTHLVRDTYHGANAVRARREATSELIDRILAESDKQDED